ncbi:hypothetical protein [Burkholderia vietnamiensis]|uniref:hypothetical protein n=1 Tax=Burkholderia vietnamiensis TaxID=60552 RepID=UPI003453D5CC
MQIALIAPRPLDALEIPAALDGRDGINRTPGRRQIAANDDLSAIRAWLARVVETKTRGMDKVSANSYHKPCSYELRLAYYYFAQ